jgi:hypothetical protein
MNWDGIKALNPRGLGTESPEEKDSPFTTVSSVPLIPDFRSFVGPMSPPSTSARAYSADRVSQSTFSLDGLGH